MRAARPSSASRASSAVDFPALIKKTAEDAGDADGAPATLCNATAKLGLCYTLLTLCGSMALLHPLSDWQSSKIRTRLHKTLREGCCNRPQMQLRRSQ
jgi:hypothetical protein